MIKMKHNGNEGVWVCLIQLTILLEWEFHNGLEVCYIMNIGKGGTHVAGFEKAITKVVNDILRATKTLKNNEADVIKDDVQEALTKQDKLNRLINRVKI